jgi:hypothetical protein
LWYGPRVMAARGCNQGLERARPETYPNRLIPLMANSPRTRFAAFAGMAFAVWLSATLVAAPQSAVKDLPVSLDRIRQDLAKAPATGLKEKLPVKVPVATFKSRVEQRVYVLTLREWIDKEFALNTLQRQSADWASKCCGYVLASGAYGVRLDPLFDALDKAVERRRVRNIRKQIARELSELEAARTKELSADKQ